MRYRPLSLCWDIYLATLAPSGSQAPRSRVQHRVTVRSPAITRPAHPQRTSLSLERAHARPPPPTFERERASAAVANGQYGWSSDAARPRQGRKAGLRQGRKQGRSSCCNSAAAPSERSAEHATKCCGSLHGSHALEIDVRDNLRRRRRCPLLDRVERDARAVPPLGELGAVGGLGRRVVTAEEGVGIRSEAARRR